MSQPEALPMTPTCAAVIRWYDGDKTAAQSMRRDVFQKGHTRCMRAGWLADTDTWPYTGVTEAGRVAASAYAASR